MVGYLSSELSNVAAYQPREISLSYTPWPWMIWTDCKSGNTREAFVNQPYHIRSENSCSALEESSCTGAQEPLKLFFSEEKRSLPASEELVAREAVCQVPQEQSAPFWCMPWHNTRKTSYWNREKKNNHSDLYWLREQKYSRRQRTTLEGQTRLLGMKQKQEHNLWNLSQGTARKRTVGPQAHRPQSARVVPGGNHETEMVRCGSSGFNSITLVNCSLVKENYNALIQRGRKDFSDCQAAVTYVRPGQLNHKSRTVQVLGCGRENLTPRHSPVTQPQRLTLPDVSTGLGFPGHMLLFRHRITSLQTRWSASRSARSAPVWGGHIPASGATHLARLHCLCSAGCWAEQSNCQGKWVGLEQYHSWLSKRDWQSWEQTMYLSQRVWLKSTQNLQQCEQ